MKAPKEHEIYLAKRDYPLKCSSKVFNDQELKVLRRYGYWIEALVTGVVSPFTKEQRKLVDVHNGKAEPESENEQAWVKLIERRRWEADAEKSPHHSVIDKSEEWFSRSDWKKMRNWKVSQ
jgi:uncharacterized protein YifE (UPF0438 family)